MGAINNNRVSSIDVVRGLAMVIMALDHIRDYFHITANTHDPLDLATTSPGLFMTRWITHFCAPAFVLLSGTSIFLQGQRKSTTELASFLVKRGLWLVFAEIFIVSLAWTFNPAYEIIPFQVIWAIGMSMIIMGILVFFKVPTQWMVMMGLVIVMGHNAFDFVEDDPGFQATLWWDFLHYGFFTAHEILPGHNAMLVYAFPVWTGVMLLGYGLGQWFVADYSAEKRRKNLLNMGLGLLVIFVLLRFTNWYGDPIDWSVQATPLLTFLSFINVDKYPASLLYLSIMLGFALIFLAVLERVKNRLTAMLTVFGRTAFFYYILHLYLIHALATGLFFMRGHTMDEVYNPENHFPFLYVVPGEGLSLSGVYMVWIGVIVFLYPLCYFYDRYKTSHKEQWWLSYL